MRHFLLIPYFNHNKTSAFFVRNQLVWHKRHPPAGLTKVAEADALQVIPVLFFLGDEMLKEIVTMGFRRDRLRPEMIRFMMKIL